MHVSRPVSSSQHHSGHDVTGAGAAAASTHSLPSQRKQQTGLKDSVADGQTELDMAGHEAAHSGSHAAVHAVDPIEAFAPAFVLERFVQTAQPGPSAAHQSLEAADLAAASSRVAQLAPVNISRAASKAEAGLQSQSVQMSAGAAQAAEGEWHGFAANDDSSADGAGAEQTAEVNASTQNEGTALTETHSLDQREDDQYQPGSDAAIPASAIEKQLQGDSQQAALYAAAAALARPASQDAGLASHMAQQNQPAATLSLDAQPQGLPELSPNAVSAKSAAAWPASKDLQAAFSRKAAPQSGIPGARKALQAMALKAAAEAAYKISDRAASSGGHQAQAAMRRSTSSTSRQSDAAWSPLSPKASQAEQPGDPHSLVPANCYHAM